MFLPLYYLGLGFFDSLLFVFLKHYKLLWGWGWGGMEEASLAVPSLQPTLQFAVGTDKPLTFSFNMDPMSWFILF